MEGILLIFRKNISRPGFALMMNTQLWCLPQRSLFLIHPHRTGFSGKSCNQFQAAVLPLKILPQKIVVLEQVADEAFCPKSLDYFNFDSDEVRQCIRRDYQSFVMSAGLTCSDDNALLLTQPLYPLDASESNLRALTSDQINLDRLNVSNGLVLFVVGVNCD